MKKITLTKDDAISMAGNASQLARILDITPQAIWKWPSNSIPETSYLRLKDRRPAWFRAKKAQAEQ